MRNLITFPNVKNILKNKNMMYNILIILEFYPQPLNLCPSALCGIGFRGWLRGCISTLNPST
jgi:hypothetical protein